MAYFRSKEYDVIKTAAIVGRDQQFWRKISRLYGWGVVALLLVNAVAAALLYALWDRIGKGDAGPITFLVLVFLPLCWVACAVQWGRAKFYGWLNRGD